MRTHPESVEVQAASCGALWSLSADAAGRASIKEEEGTQNLLSSLRRHCESKEVQENCLGTISNLARDLNDHTIESSLIVSVVVGVVSAMNSRISSDTMQAEGCAALWALSALDIGLLSMESVGTLDVLVGAMAGHPVSFEVHKAALGALDNMLRATAPERHLIDAIFPLVSASLQRWSQSAHVQQLGCSVLALVVASPAVQDGIAEITTGAYDETMRLADEARRKFVQNNGVQEATAQLLELCRACNACSTPYVGLGGSFAASG
jgi:hypothetical protein